MVKKEEIQIKKSTIWWTIGIILGVILLFWLVGNSEDNYYQDDNRNLDDQFKQQNQVYCGDGTCSYSESCSSCFSDCGQCPEEIDNNIKQTIVWVKYNVAGKNIDGSYFENSGTGSGVIVANKSNELTIYTNRHVVDCEYNDMNCYQRISENIQVRTQDGILHNIDRVSFSVSDVDLAILTIKTPNAGNYNFAYYTDQFDINDKVIAVGYPSYAKNVVEFSISKGRITNIKDVLSQSTGDSFRTIESDAYTYFGSSGGGLFDEEGNLIGINTWLEGTQTSIAIDFNSIREQSFTYCSSDSYFTNKKCHEYKSRLSCPEGYVLGDDDLCHVACGSPTIYCKTGQCFNGQCVSCPEGYVLGDDDLCHVACGSPTTYCEQGSYCFNNNCISCPSGYYLGVDGRCYPN